MTFRRTCVAYLYHWARVTSHHIWLFHAPRYVYRFMHMNLQLWTLRYSHIKVISFWKAYGTICCNIHFLNILNMPTKRYFRWNSIVLISVATLCRESDYHIYIGNPINNIVAQKPSCCPYITFDWTTVKLFLIYGNLILIILYWLSVVFTLKCLPLYICHLYGDIFSRNVLMAPTCSSLGPVTVFLIR